MVPISIEFYKPKVLLVEGPEDERFFSGLLGFLNIRDGFQLVQYEGTGNIVEGHH